MAKKKPRIPSQERTRLLRLAIKLYVAKFNVSPFTLRGKKMRNIVFDLCGLRVGTPGAWEWLAKQPDDGLPPPKPPKRDYIPRTDRKAFYEGVRWRNLRFEALRAANGCCVLCGHSNRVHGVTLHVDHIKPRSLYPQLELDPENLQVLCEACNIGKSNRDDTDWRVGR